MQVVALNDLHTIVIGLTALQVAGLIVRKIPVIAKLNIPTPVIGGVLGALVVAMVRAVWGIEIHFAKYLTDFMLLVFFTSVGLSAKLSALKAGGKPLLIVCAATVLLILVQNLAGVLIALGFGKHPFYGLLAGSISFIGGPGTAAAWAKQVEGTPGLERAPELAAAAATLAVVVGALVAGPVTGWLIEKKKLRASSPPTTIPWRKKEDLPPPTATAAEPKPISTEKAMATFLLILVAVLLGQTLNDAVKAVNFPLPGFLTAMLAGVAITNLADVFGWKLDFEPIERDGELALKTFLVMFLMGLKLWVLGAAIVPLVTVVAVQVVVSCAVAIFLLFRWLGRDYDAAVTVGGFLGFGLSSMAVGMSSMDKVTSRYGPSPKAFLLVTLAGSFFVDLANAAITQLTLRMPMFQ